MTAQMAGRAWEAHSRANVAWQPASGQAVKKSVKQALQVCKWRGVFPPAMTTIYVIKILATDLTKALAIRTA